MADPYIRRIMYDVVIVDIVTLDREQEVTFSASVVDGVFGTIYVQGEITPSDGRTWGTDIELHVWRTPASWSIWTGKPGPAEAKIKAGPDGAQSVCLSKTRDQGRTVQHIALDGSATIPAGWGVVVAFGTATIGDQAAEQGNYFAPRDEDREVTGSGDLLLVR